MQTDTGSWWRSRWWTPLFSLGLGAVIFTAFAIGGNTGDGTMAFAVMGAVAVVFLIGSIRSETLSGIGGSGRDERWQAIDLRASAFSGFAVTLAVAGGWLYELAQGNDGSPYGQLLAVGGIAYILGIAFLRWRG
jgi:hypothetical protein